MIRRIQTRVREFVTVLLKEDLSPGRAAAAVFLGIFIGIVPIYGFQLIVAVGLAFLFRLNKPLTVAGTFINNPLLQPLIVASSVELGYLLREGGFRPFHLSNLAGAHMKDEIVAFVMGSVVLGILVGGAGAAITAVVVRRRTAGAGLSSSELRDPESGDFIIFVNRKFDQCAWADRGFVRWKLRLDRIFKLLTELLATQEQRTGTVVDLGCGYGMALSLAAFGDGGRRLVGCDLDAHRIAVARQALSALNADLSVADVRGFELPAASLIIILDVLQYLTADEQVSLLERCCAALTAEGMLIFRVHDRERGLWSTITMAFDRLIFACSRAGTRPLVLAAAEYRRVLERAGMCVDERPFRNRLPLAHILFIAKKSLSEDWQGAAGAAP